VAEGSRVAHMWRDPANPKTMLRYSIPTNDVRRNRLRAAVAWFDGWADKVRTFPQFEDFKEGGPLQIGSLENMEYYRKKLKCKGFASYLERFKDFYLDTGRLPDSVYNLRERKTGLCLSHEFANGKSKGFILSPCSQGSELQRFHEANSGSRGRCCSGVKAWDFDACLTAWAANSDLTTSGCDYFGRSTGQHFKLSDRGNLEWNGRSGCLAPKSAPEAGQMRVGRFSSAACPSRVEPLGGQQLRIVSRGLCLTAPEPGEAMSFETCGDAGNKAQVWTSSSSRRANRLQLKSNAGLCIENVAGVPALRKCEEESGHQQLFLANLTGRVLLEGDAAPLHLCAEAPPVEAVRLAECATEGQRAKFGQGFSKLDVKADGTSLLQDEELGTCLKPQKQGGQTVLVSAECPSNQHDPEWRWHHDPVGGQLRNAALDMCVDANDFHTLIIYPCYAPGQNLKQRYLLRSNGWLEMPRSWADNGRLRYPAQCLDSQPIAPLGLTVEDCREAQKSGVSWERAWPEVPLETQLWRKAVAKNSFLNRYQ